MNFREDTLAEALKSFASSSLGAGGGGAAALAGALGAALLCMVARLALKNDPASPSSETLVELLDRGLRFQRDLEDLMERDPLSYQRVAKALRAVRRDPGARPELDAALREATRVPLETASAALGCLQVAAELADLGIAKTITEVGTGAYLCHAALRGAVCTAADNLKDISDPAFEAAVCADMVDLSAADDLVEHVSAVVASLTHMNETFRHACSAP